MADIKVIPKKDLPVFAKLASAAFPGMGIATEEQIKDLAEKLKLRYDAKDSNFWGVYKKQELIAGVIFYDFTMNLFGKKVLCGGGGFLVVSLLHKKEHAARDLCKYFFEHYRKRNALFASLYPFRPDFYRKMGVGYGTKASVYKFRCKDLPSNGSKKHLRELTKKDIPKMITCFNSYADRKTGMFYDSKDYRERFFRQNSGAKFYGYEKENKLLGYLVLNFEKCKPNNFLEYNTKIVELVYLDREVLASFMHFLQTQKDQIDRVEWVTFDDNFHYLPFDPGNGSGNMYPSVFHETNHTAIGIMYRALNNKEIFATLKDRSFNEQTLRVKFKIKDSFLKMNSKPFIVYFENGYPTVKTINSRSDVTLTIDIADFSSLILGAVDLKSLHRYKLAELSNDKYLNQLNELFRTAHKPECLMHF